MLFFLKQYLKKWKTDRKKIQGRIVRQCAMEYLRENALSAEEKERIAQLGERLGYLDREMQLRQLSLYESEFERMIQNAKETAPGKEKNVSQSGRFRRCNDCDSVLVGGNLGERGRGMEVTIIFKIAGGRNPGFHSVAGAETQRKGRAGIYGQSCRASYRSFLDSPLYL